jgi:hypothetical protein
MRGGQLLHAVVTRIWLRPLNQDSCYTALIIIQIPRLFLIDKSTQATFIHPNVFI